MHRPLYLLGAQEWALTGQYLCNSMPQCLVFPCSIGNLHKDQNIPVVTSRLILMPVLASLADNEQTTGIIITAHVLGQHIWAAAGSWQCWT